MAEGNCEEKDKIKDNLLTMMRLMTKDTWYLDKSKESIASRTGENVELQFAGFSAFILRYLNAESQSRFIPLMNVWCSICNAYISGHYGPGATASPRSSYNCVICLHGDFDVCSACYNKGIRCYSPQQTIRLAPITHLWLPQEPEIFRVLKSHTAEGRPGRFYRHLI